MKIYMKYLFHYLLFISIELIQSGKVIEINDNLSELKYKNQNYIYAYTIPHSLMTFESNGGNPTYHDISLAFDNDFKLFGILNNIKLTLF